MSWAHTTQDHVSNSPHVRQEWLLRQPQRLYVMSDDEGKFIQCWDEGYNGYHAVPEELRNDAYLAQRVNVSVTKYKQLLRTLPTSKVSKESFLKVAAWSLQIGLTNHSPFCSY